MRSLLVTGAGGGIGAAVTEALAAAGYRVFALDIAPIPVRENVVPILADLTDTESIERAFAAVSAMTDCLFAIVHVAGIYRAGSLVEMSEETFTRAYDINLFGGFRVNKTFLPLLKRGSRIILTSSELGPLDPLPFTGLYGITKSAVEKYAYALRMELQLLGIDVTVLRPGAVRTGLLDVSTRELDAFCESTKLYAFSARRFRTIVDRVEARNVSPERVAQRVVRTLARRRPPYVVKLNRNPLLLLLSA
ncbi:MAG: SDR family NAD(P)-dependent oxidoreductase, partial [Clostridia bacterium]|nr:SDR family NAD(P)-dependent oxidoreductase [Clostridia bacterium]